MNIIVAYCNNYGIGKDNKLPWYFKSDLRYFSKKTRGDGNNAILMGKNTWLSLPIKPLPNRDNFVLSTSLNIHNCFMSINEAKEYFNNNNYDDIWIIGGSSIYEQFINDTDVKKIYVSEIKKDYDCDTFFPKFSDDYILSSVKVCDENDTKIEFKVYDRVK